MHYSRFRQSEYLDAAALLMSCAVDDPIISKSMGDVGYTAQKLGQGKEMFIKFQSLFNSHQELSEKKLAVNKSRKDKYDATRKLYMRALKIARIAFQDNETAAEDLLLNGEREKDMDLWILQAGEFCKFALNSEVYIQRLSQFGVDILAIKEIAILLDELKVINIEKRRVEEELLLLTQYKKQAMVKFQKWLSDYVKMARIRFDNNPEILKRLSIT